MRTLIVQIRRNMTGLSSHVLPVEEAERVWCPKAVPEDPQYGRTCLTIHCTPGSAFTEPFGSRVAAHLCRSERTRR